jgi:hypothetical protein
MYKINDLLKKTFSVVSLILLKLEVVSCLQGDERVTAPNYITTKWGKSRIVKIEIKKLRIEN